MLFSILRYNQWDPFFHTRSERKRSFDSKWVGDRAPWTLSLFLSLSIYIYMYISRTYPSSPLCMSSGVSWISMVKRSVTYSLRNSQRSRARTYVCTCVRTHIHTCVSSFPFSIHMVYWDSRIRGVVRLLGGSGQVVHQARITFLKGTKIARSGSLETPISSQKILAFPRTKIL